MVSQQETGVQTTEGRIEKRPLVIKPIKLIFYTVFIFVFLLSGFIVMADVIPYRMNLVSLLVIPLFFLYGLRIDRIGILFGLLTSIVFLSAIYNQVSVTQTILFFRGILFTFLIYSVVRFFVNKNNITTIIRLCVIIGMVQLPIMLFQIMTYDFLPGRITSGLGISRLDYDFGTFHFKGDAAMTFFLTLLIIFLLFDLKRIYIIRYRWFVVLWLTLTVLLSNSELMKFAVIIVWVVYSIRYFNVRTLIYGATGLLLVFGILTFAGVFDEIIADFSRALSGNLSTADSKVAAFNSGNYGRGAAIDFYLNNELEVIGDGPSKYYDVVTRERTRGNYGHIFTYYSEVGLLGLLFSYLIFFFIAFPMRDGHIRVSWVGFLMFAVLVMLSITTDIMPNISIVLIYCIVALTYLIPMQEA